MREIKFRGLMTTGELVYELPHLDLKGTTAYWDECSYRICWEPESGGSANAPIKNGTLSQFTGLKDKNGIDIYEGDINQDKGVVIWNKSDASFCWDYKGVEVMSMGEENDWCEIIGNIYENPELINNKEEVEHNQGG